MPTTCARCAAEIPPDQKFCGQCGSKVDDVADLVAELADVDGLAHVLARETEGTYEIRDELGRGGMAAVFLARELALDRLVAIKVMLADLQSRSDMRERFLLEARTAARLSHPHVIPIYAVNQSERLTYFVMKYVEGRPLDAILDGEAALPPGRVVKLLTEVGGALSYAHENGVVHRDVKPANILIDEGGRAVVTDFGIAKVAEAHGLTMTGATVGTPTYMSPEQCTGSAVSGASDQYALGVVGYEMLSGRRPFDGDLPMAVMWAQVHDAPPDLADAVVDVPPHIVAAVTRMLEKDPAARWPSIEDALTALRSPLSLEVQPPAAPRAASVDVVPARATASVGESWLVEAVVKDADGRRITDQPIEWSMSDPAVATVAPDGQAVANHVGATTLVAQCGDLTGEAHVSVTRVGVATLDLSLQRTLDAGDSVRVVVNARDRMRNALRDRVVTWGSSDPAVAEVGPDGRLVARAAGKAEIVAECGGAFTTARVTVRQPMIASVRVEPNESSVSVGQSLDLIAAASDAKGRSLADLPARWISTDPKVAVVSDAGRVTAVSPGEARIAAVVGNRRAIAHVRVPIMTIAR